MILQLGDTKMQIVFNRCVVDECWIS